MIRLEEVESFTGVTPEARQTVGPPAGVVSRTERLRLALRVFAVFLAVYLCTWAGHYTSGDGAFKVAWAKAILHGDHQGVPSKYGIGHTLLALPAIAIAEFVRAKTGHGVEAALYTLMFVVNAALFLGLLAFYLAEFYRSAAVWKTVSILGLATSWWPYANMDFSEQLVLTAIFLGFVVMRSGAPFWGMLIAAYAVTLRTDSIFLVALLALWYLWERRSARVAARLACAIVPWIALYAFANFIRYHSIFDHGYDREQFTTPLLVGLYGILLSGGKSIFLFSPPLLLGFLGWKRFRSQPALRNDAALFFAIFTVQVCLYARWWDWSSDDAWGVRFLIPGVLLMCIPVVTILEKRWLVASLVAAGLCVQLLAVSVGGLDYLLLVRAHAAERQDLFAAGQNRIDLEDVRYNVRYSQIAGNWMLLRCLLHADPQPGSAETLTRGETPLYDTLPPEVWHQAAHWDPLSLLALQHLLTRR